MELKSHEKKEEKKKEEKKKEEKQVVWESNWEATVIHLKRAVERDIEFKSALKQYSNILWKYHLVDPDPRGGAFGAATSHLSIIQQAKRENKPFVVVFEDDLLPTQQFSKSILDNAIQIMTIHNIDCFLGGVCHSKGGELLDHNKHVRYVKLKYAQMLHCVIYMSSSYNKMLTYNWMVPIDIWVGQQLSILTSLPFIALQRPGISSIAKEFTNWNTLMKMDELRIDKHIHLKELLSTI
jgi:hypothetical protein